MNLLADIQTLAARIPNQLEHLQTEEATKTALVMPFINALGYNVFDPTEVVPEFTADINPRRAEKVDYAIMRDGKPIILIECKAAKCNLDDVHPAQLKRYFNMTEARIGVLTNGVDYRFHSDLDRPNIMDEEPFLEFSVLELDDSLVEELNGFSKTSFDLDSTIDASSQLKYTNEVKKILFEQLNDPTDEFIKFFASKIYPKRTMRQKLLREFSPLTRKAFAQFITDRVHDRFKLAMATDGAENQVR